MNTELLEMGLNAFWVVATLWFVARLNAMLIMGAYIAANDKDSKGRYLILGELNQRIKKVLGDYWYKPIFGCYKCMASVWGGIPMSIILIHLLPLIYLPIIPIFGAAYTGIVCYISTSLYEKRALTQKQLDVAVADLKLKEKELGEEIDACAT